MIRASAFHKMPYAVLFIYNGLLFRGGEGEQYNAAEKWKMQCFVHAVKKDRP